MYTISTLAALRRHLGLSIADSAEDLRLLDALEAASAAVERRSARRYLPYHATIWHSLDLHDVSELLMRDDLIELAAIVNGDGQSIPLDDVLLLPGGVLRLTNGAAFAYVDTPEDAIAVSGLWGYHPHPDRAWLQGVAMSQTPLDAVTTTITVSDSSAFEVGQVLRLDDELCVLVAVDEAQDTLTVERGRLDTSAVSHEAVTPIAVYQPPADVVALVLRWAAWLYREPDASLAEMPPILLMSLSGLQRVTVR